MSLVACSSVRAQTHSGIIIDPWAKEIWGQTLEKVLIENKESVEGGGHAQSFIWDSYGRFRFGKDNPDAPVAGYRSFSGSFNTDHVAPGIPDQLVKIEVVGGFCLGEVEHGKLYFLGVIGYEGNKPFGNLGDSIYGIGRLFWRKPLDECNTLALTLDYDGGTAFLPDVPLPGFGIIHDGDVVDYTFGFPRDAIVWHMCEHLTLLGQYTMPMNAEAYLNYRLTEHWSVFGNITNFYEAFVLFKQDSSHHFFEQMRRVEVGIHYEKKDIWHGLDVDAAGMVGYAFDQDFEAGFDVRSTRHVSSFSDAPYVGLIVRGTL